MFPLYTTVTDTLLGRCLYITAWRVVYILQYARALCVYEAMSTGLLAENENLRAQVNER